MSQYLSSWGPLYTSHSAPPQLNFVPLGVEFDENFKKPTYRVSTSGFHNVSPQQCNPVETFDGSQLNPSPTSITGSTIHSGMFMGQTQNLAEKPESPTLVSTDTPQSVSITCTCTYMYM